MLKSISVIVIGMLMTTGCASPEAQVVGPPTEEEVTFMGGDSTLAGTLSLPGTNAKRHKAIILVSGSGPQDRHCDIQGFPMFKMLADTFNAMGYAVLRYDDRGYGQSKGKGVGESTSVEIAEDARAAYQFLKSREDIDSKRIGMLGHSEGGIIAPMVASQESDLAYIILMSGHGVTGADLSNAQTAAVLRGSGIPDTFIEASGKLNIEILQFMKEARIHPDTLRAYSKKKALALLDLLPPEVLKTIPDREAYASNATEQAMAQSGSPWIFFYMTYDPLPTLQQVKCPTLLIFGELDTQVPPEQNRDLMSNALTKGGNTNVKVVTIPKANHIYQEAIAGSPGEYMLLPKQYAAGFFDAIEEWLKSLKG